MKISYSLEQKNSCLFLTPKKNKQDIQPKAKSKLYPQIDIKTRFRFADLSKSRVVDHQKPRKISFLQKIWYSYFSQRKTVWIRTQGKEVVVNRQELTHHLGVSRWGLMKHLCKNNVVDPKFIDSSISHAYSSVENLDGELKECIERLKTLKVRLCVGGFGEKSTKKAGFEFEKSLDILLNSMKDPTKNTDPYNKKLLGALQKMRKFNPKGAHFDPKTQVTVEWKVKLDELRSALDCGAIWWEQQIKWNKAQL